MTDKNDKDMNALAGCFVLASLVLDIALSIALGLLFGAWVAWIVFAVYAALWMLILFAAFRKAAKSKKDSNDGDRN